MLSSSSESDLPVLASVLVGTGWVAGGYDRPRAPNRVRTHALAYREEGRTELCAVADPDLARANEFARDWQITSVYGDAAQMLEEIGPDLVSICTPDTTHEDYLRLCLEFPSVRGVWCEKPLAVNPAGLQNLLADYARAGKALLVNYQRNFAPGYRAIRHDLEAGHFGEVQKIVIYYTKGIMHNGSHALAVLIDWFGEPVSIQVTQAVCDVYPEDPTVDACIRFGNAAVYLVGLAENRFTFFEFDFFFDRAALRFTDSASRSQLRFVDPQPLPSGHRVLHKGEENDLNTGIAMSAALAELIQAVLEKRVEINGRLALSVLEVSHALAQEGMDWVRKHEQ